MLKGEPDVDEELEGRSLFDLGLTNQSAAEVEYNPDIPISTFDFIITDECHHSIYNRWQPVLEYFDAFIVGLTDHAVKADARILRSEFGHGV